MKTETMLQLFVLFLLYCKETGTERVNDNCILNNYHNKPSLADLYALFWHNASLIRRDVNSKIDLSTPVRYSKRRTWTINKARIEGLEIIESTDFTAFWTLLPDVPYSNHNTAPYTQRQRCAYWQAY